MITRYMCFGFQVHLGSSPVLQPLGSWSEKWHKVQKVGKESQICLIGRIALRLLVSILDFFVQLSSTFVGYHLFCPQEHRVLSPAL